MATATTVRLPADLHDRLASYCEQTGAVRNRVMALALREYLGRNRLPHLWIDEPAEVAGVQAAHDVAHADLPVAVIGSTVIRAAGSSLVRA